VFSEPEGTVAVAEGQFNEILKQGEGTEYIVIRSDNGLIDIAELLKALGQRQITTVMIEGGSKLLGYVFDHKLVDKVLAFVAPIIIGGEEAKTAVSGRGVEKVADALQLKDIKIEKFDAEFLVSGYT
jgi:diaminohydroxyphosphoribosylaminopyrimidine deaminase/5-amino-6-(5-phosphoribosylamino)uracil reductase